MKALALGLLLLAVPADDRISLDGRMFQVLVLDTTTNKTYPDLIWFEDGKLQTRASEAWRFVAAEYRVSRDGEALGFEAVASSKKEGTNEWRGTISGEEIEGTLVWSKEKNEPLRYTYRGSSKK